MLRKNENALVAKEKKLKIVTLEQAHNQLGHMDEHQTKSVVQSLGWKIENGIMGPCAACARGKARQMNIKKKFVEEPTSEGVLCSFSDISTLRPKKGMPNMSTPHWRIIVVDPKIQLKFVHFF